MKYALSLFMTGLLTSSAAFAAEVDVSKLPPPAAKPSLTFEKDIHPLFEASCVRCHSGDRPKARLRLDTLENALKGGEDGKVITPGDSAKSKLVIAISRLDPRSAMPPNPPQRRRGGANRPGAPAQNAAGENGQSPAGGTTPPAGTPPGGAQRGGMEGPPPKPLTAEQVGLVRAWIDQGAK